MSMVARTRSPPPPMPKGVIEAECLDRALNGDVSGSSRTAIFFETTVVVCTV